jgi:hypothetical protein
MAAAAAKRKFDQVCSGDAVITDEGEDKRVRLLAPIPSSSHLGAASAHSSSMYDSDIGDQDSADEDEGADEDEDEDYEELPRKAAVSSSAASIEAAIETELPAAAAVAAPAATTSPSTSRAGERPPLIWPLVPSVSHYRDWTHRLDVRSSGIPGVHGRGVFVRAGVTIPAEEVLGVYRGDKYRVNSRGKLLKPPPGVEEDANVWLIEARGPKGKRKDVVLHVVDGRGPNGVHLDLVRDPHNAVKFINAPPLPNCSFEYLPEVDAVIVRTKRELHAGEELMSVYGSESATRKIIEQGAKAVGAGQDENASSASFANIGSNGPPGAAASPQPAAVPVAAPASAASVGYAPPGERHLDQLRHLDELQRRDHRIAQLTAQLEVANRSLRTEREKAARRADAIVKALAM